MNFFIQFIGTVAIIFIIFNINLHVEVKEIKEGITKINNSIKGENKMSEMLKELEGKRCKISVHGIFETRIHCEVIHVDDEWMKISQIINTKKDIRKIKIIRIDNIYNISIV